MSISERKLLWLFASVQLTLILDFMILMPLGPELMRSLSLSPAGFGALVSVYTLASAGVGFSGAFWLHWFDRRQLLLWLYALFIFASAACGLVVQASELLVARIVAGAAAGLIWSLVLALVVELVPAERRGDAIGTVMTSYAVSAVMGVPLGLVLADKWSWRAPFLLVAGVSLFLWGCLAVVLESPPNFSSSPGSAAVKGDEKSLWKPVYFWSWLLTFCVVFSGFLLIPYLGTFMTYNLGLQASELPWVYFSGGVATFFSSRLLGRLVDVRSPVWVLACLLLGTVVPHLFITHLKSPSLFVVVVSFVLFMTLTSGRIIPTLALITERVPTQLSARFLAVNTATADVSSGIAAWLSGVSIATSVGGGLSGFGRVGWAAACMTGCTLVVLFMQRRSVARSLQSSAESGAN